MLNKRMKFLDFFRGILMCSIIFYHYAFNLSYFLDYDINLYSFPLVIIPPISSALFLFVSGFSSNLSRNSLKRGLYIFFWAIIITLVTLYFFPEAPITFGILHCIAVSMIFSYFLRDFSTKIIISLAIMIFASGYLINNIAFDNSYLFFLGITGPGYSALDYYPLVPHSAFFLFGMAVGKNIDNFPFLYKFKIKNKIGELITLFGRNSLKVYLVHQPLFFLIYFLLNFILTNKNL